MGGGNAEVCFSLTPPVTRDYSGQATLSTNDPGIVDLTTPLTGWGGGPQISCTPLSIDFGHTLDHSVTTVPILCTNVGAAAPGDGGLVIESAEVDADLAPRVTLLRQDE